MPSVCRTSGKPSLTPGVPPLSNSNPNTQSSSEVQPNCMKGSSHKRSRTRTRIRSRRSPKKRKKMLPARVARLLGSKLGVGQITKAANVISAGTDSRVGLVARDHTSVQNLCNIEPRSGNRTLVTSSSCQVKCGASLFINNNSTLLTSNESQSSTDTLCEPNGSASESSSRIDKCIAIDCEMVGVGERGSQSALGRCSIVNYSGDVIYDKYVKPDVPVTDYRTPWSGISEEHMEQAILHYEAKEQISKILKDKIVIGHDVKNDFSVLHLKHPREDIRDTSKYRGLRYLAGVDGKKRSVGLKAMVERLTGKKIQSGPHCSVEDARAAMSLYRLLDGQWEEDTISLFPDKQFRSGFLDDHFWPEDL